MQKLLIYITGIVMVLPLGAIAGTISPSIDTTLAKNVTHNSAMIYATVAGGSAEDNGYWFEWGVVGSHDDVIFRTQRRSIGTNTNARTVSATIRGLAPKTQYYFRVAADNQKSSVAGNIIYFTTRDLEIPTSPVVLVTTRQVTTVRDDTAKVYGYVAPHGGTAEYWFDYGTDEKLTMHSSAQKINGNGLEVNMTLKALVSGTTYYYRIAAENDRGITYGAIKSFKTAGEKPPVEIKTTQKVTQPVKATASSTPSKTSSSNSGFSLFGKKTESVEEKTTKNELTGSVGDSTKDVSVSIKTLTTSGSKGTIEYKISYVYNRSESGVKAELRVSVPPSLVYIGDTTANELLVAEGSGGTKIYILPIGAIKKGDTRTVSIMTMKTGDVVNTPKVDAKLLFTTKNGKLMTTTALLGSVQSSSSQTGGSFPTRLILWFVVLNLIVASVILSIKAKEWYLKVREQKNVDDKLSIQVEKNIEDALSLHSQIPVPAFVSIASGDTSSYTPAIPKKPKITDEYKPVRIQEVGLPGMEIIEDNEPQIQ